MGFLLLITIIACHSNRVCKFNDPNMGEIKFRGNLLFTHFNEVGAPDPSGGRRPEETELSLSTGLGTPYAEANLTVQS